MLQIFALDTATAAATARIRASLQANIPDGLIALLLLQKDGVTLQQGSSSSVSSSRH